MYNMLLKKILPHPEIIFLIVSISFGILFSLIQPLFIEPDAVYHFDNAMYISDTVVDRSEVGVTSEDYGSKPIPFTLISEMYKNDLYYKNLFFKKLPLIPKHNADKRVSGNYGTENDKTYFSDIMHVVPAIGVKLGYFIYPSIGSMILTARIISVIFFSLCMFFIIKASKVYKYMFLMISLTPTVMQIVTSLSYDTYNYLACSLMIMVCINMGIDIKKKEKISIIDFFIRILIPSIILYYSKMNSKLLYLIPFVILLYLIKQKVKINFNKGTIILISLFAMFVFGGIVLTLYFEQTVFITKKIVFTLLEPYYTVLSTELISGTTTAGIPNWFYGIQFATLILLFLSYNKVDLPWWFTAFATIVFALNFFAIMISYAMDNNFSDYAGRIITGPQGRYFTPFIILLAPMFSRIAQKISVSFNKWLILLVLVVIVVSLILNLSITSLKFYVLQIPADEWRSGIHHYIFK